jgi:hypothetical protein
VHSVSRMSAYLRQEGSPSHRGMAVNNDMSMSVREGTQLDDAFSWVDFLLTASTLSSYVSRVLTTADALDCLHMALYSGMRLCVCVCVTVCKYVCK